MNRLVRLDYWKGFSWSNIKAFFGRNKKNMGGWIAIALLWGVQCIGDEGNLSALALVVCGVPLVLLFWSLAMTSISLPKVMHMSPMTVNEREVFIKKKWKLAILVPNVVNIVFIVIGFVMRQDALSLAFVLVHFVMMSFGAIFYSGKSAKRFEVGIDKVFPVYAIFCEIVSVIIHVCATMLIVDDGSIGNVMLGIFAGAMVLLELPLLIKLMTYKKKLVSNIVNYEATYDVGSY